MTPLLQEWNRLFSDISLSSLQQEQCQKYLMLLEEWNKKFNITTLVGADAITYHFQDSFAFIKTGYHDKQHPNRIVDVGSGGGFPGIPLKIYYPDTPVVLIEVQQKKILFLREVIAQLGLQNIEVCSHDWLTFIAKEPCKADLFVARASLKPEELIRVFSAREYKKSTLVYWATSAWKASATVAPYVVDEIIYTVGDRERKLVFLQRKAAPAVRRARARSKE